MELPRTSYVEQLAKKKGDGRIKVITGIRRCGKSYLLFRLYRQYLQNHGVSEQQIISLALDELQNAKYRNPFELDAYVRGHIQHSSVNYYVFIDEIQFVEEVQNPYLDVKSQKITFIDTILGWMSMPNVDVYVTGSNSKMLSSDILTQFRDRADDIRVYPLSYAEFYDAYNGDKRRAWPDYYTYGGMPVVLTLDTHEKKSVYLRNLLDRMYIRDVLERNTVQHDAEVLDNVLNILASGVGSLTNPTRIANTFAAENHVQISAQTVARYIDYFMNVFLIDKAQRYEVKGRKYISTPVKYYFTDVGLRNARLNFRQIEQTHLMENVIFNDLKRRGFDVDVGVVPYNTKTEDGKHILKQLEVDFVVNRGDARYYIQSALSVADPEKKAQETASLLRVPDSFQKIVVVGDYINPWKDGAGIQYVGVEDFLLDESFIGRWPFYAMHDAYSGLRHGHCTFQSDDATLHDVRKSKQPAR